MPEADKLASSPNPAKQGVGQLTSQWGVGLPLEAGEVKSSPG